MFKSLTETVMYTQPGTPPSCVLLASPRSNTQCECCELVAIPPGLVPVISVQKKVKQETLQLQVNLVYPNMLFRPVWASEVHVSKGKENNFKTLIYFIVNNNPPPQNSICSVKVLSNPRFVESMVAENKDMESRLCSFSEHICRGYLVSFFHVLRRFIFCGEWKVLLGGNTSSSVPRPTALPLWQMSPLFRWEVLGKSWKDQDFSV